MKYLALTLAPIAGSALASWNNLHLIRWHDGTKKIKPVVETSRASFEYAQDCELIARHMNQAEPLVTWYCK